MTTLYVSPHLDDVALSCAGRLISELENQQPVVVATVFSAASGAAHRRYRRRRDEDRAALATLGAEVRHLGLQDAAFRLGCGFDVAALSVPPRADDVRAVTAAIGRVIDDVKPDRVWFPAAVGGHVDHRAVFAAREGVSTYVRLYVERPYAFDADVLAARADQLTIQHVPWPRACFDRVIAAIDTYRSQLSWLFDSPSSRGAYERHAMAGGEFFELVAEVTKTGTTEGTGNVRPG